VCLYTRIYGAGNTRASNSRANDSNASDSIASNSDTSNSDASNSDTSNSRANNSDTSKSNMSDSSVTIRPPSKAYNDLYSSIVISYLLAALLLLPTSYKHTYIPSPYLQTYLPTYNYTLKSISTSHNRYVLKLLVPNNPSYRS
jgi:hypothetical protein